MLISIEDLMAQKPEFVDFDYLLLNKKLISIENAIRKYTNNKFQNRLVRIETSVEDNKINWETAYLKVNDTIEISDGINKGLYVVSSIEDGITTNKSLYDYPLQLITKIEYPENIVQGAIDLLYWELVQKGKENSSIASESISRHNVSYVQRSGDNTINGYPIELFNFCEGYMRART